MNNRLTKYSLAAALALLLALPAVAYSQYDGPQGPRFGAGGPGNFAEMGERAPQRGHDNRRDFARPRGRGDFGRMGHAGIGGRGGRSSLAARALAQADQIGLTTEQREQILAAQRAGRETSINRRAAMQIAGLELRDLMDAETRDIGAIEVKLRELAEQRIAEQTGALRLDAAVSETLTVEQIDELGDLARDRGRNRPGRSGGHGRRDAR